MGFHGIRADNSLTCMQLSVIRNHKLLVCAQHKLTFVILGVQHAEGGVYMAAKVLQQNEFISSPAGPVMTGLGSSLRRLPSGDPKVSSGDHKSVPGTAATAVDGKPEGGSDAGDSVEGQTSGA